MLIHRRGAEDAEKALRYHGIFLVSLRFLGVLSASAV